MSDISNAEFEVLNVLWENSPATANQVIEQLSADKTWHEKTVKTLLSRLVKKEAIGFEKEKRTYLYYPLIKKEAYTHVESKSFIQKLFDGRVSPLVAGFAKDNKLEKSDIDELKEIISRWESSNE